MILIPPVMKPVVTVTVAATIMAMKMMAMQKRERNPAHR